MISLTNEQRLLLDLLAGEISAQPRSYSEQQLRNIDWDALLREAKAQAVPLMAAETLQPYKRYIPDYTPWKTAIAGAATANIQTAYAEQELGVLMGERPFFILKGMAAAAYYPHPQQRMLGDVDFLIDPSQQEEITHLLEQHGYQNWHVDHICHVVFRKGNAHLEMHFEIAGIPYGASGERVRTFMQNAVQHRHTASFDGWTFPAPDDLYHGVVILLHMQHHMLGEGLGLRHLCDWACYLQQTHEDAFWEPLLALFADIGLLCYAKVITKTCARYLGCVCPTWAEDADEALCDDVMNDVLTGGNFGRKDDARAKSGMMISDHGKTGTRRGKVANLFTTLHQSTAARYPAVRKCPLLYPFLDGWRVVLYLGRTVTGKRTSIRKMMPLAQQRKSVYDRLHIFEIQEEEQKP